MNSKLLKSITSLAVVAALGVGATYAAFTSNTVTITSSQVTSGNAEIKLCNATPGTGGNDWRNSISPNLAASGLVPGGSEIELTDGSPLYIGNDSGDLHNNALNGDCDSYFATEGDSDIAMKLRPNVNPPSCDTGIDPEDFRLRFQIGQQTTGFDNLTGWENNTSVFLEPTFNPDDIRLVRVFAELDQDVEEQGASCTFDITFTGEQV